MISSNIFRNKLILSYLKLEEISSTELHTWLFPFQMLIHILGRHIHRAVSLVGLAKAYGIDYVAQTQQIVHLTAMKRNRLAVINQTAQVKNNTLHNVKLMHSSY